MRDRFGTDRLLGQLKLLPNRRAVRVEGSGEYTTYEITTNYDIAGKNRLESGDVINVGGTTVNGSVSGGGDAYTVGGNIVNIQVDGPDDSVTVLQYGAEINIDSYGDEDTVRFGGDGNGSKYAFTADGITGGRGLDPADSFADERGSGLVSDGSDVYTFGGDLRSVALSPGNNVRVLVDGEEIDPYALDRAQIVTFVGNGISAEYAFTIDGNIVDQVRIEPRTDDTVGDDASGVVRGGVDQFRYRGDIETFDVAEGITVYIEGEEVDPDTIGEDA